MDEIERDMVSITDENIITTNCTVKPCLIFDTGGFEGSIITTNLLNQLHLPFYKTKDYKIFGYDKINGKCIFKFKMYNCEYEIHPHVIPITDRKGFYYTILIGNEFFKDNMVLKSSMWNTPNDAYQIIYEENI